MGYVVEQEDQSLKSPSQDIPVADPHVSDLIDTLKREVYTLRKLSEIFEAKSKN